MNRHQLSKKTPHGPLYKVTVPTFSPLDLQSEEELLLKFMNNPNSNVSKVNKPYQLKKLRTPMKSLGDRPLMTSSVGMMGSLQKSVESPSKDPFIPKIADLPIEKNSKLLLSRGLGNWLSEEGGKKEGMSFPRYAKKNGNSISSGTTGVENENQPIIIKEEEFFVENSLESTKALANYDCWDDDLPPSEWLARCQKSKPPHGRSPIFINKRYFWGGVEVLDYDNESKKFKIRILLSGKEKLVGRLSLMFNEEDHIRFMERVETGKMRQNRAEDEIRFFKYVEGKEDGMVSYLDEESRRSILGKIRKKKNEEESQIITRLVDSLMGQVEGEYKLFMKKVVVLREMQDKKNEEKFKDLRIKARFIKNEIPYYGTIAKMNFSIDQISDFLKKNHVSREKLIVDTMNKITLRSYQYENFSLFKLNIDPKFLPMTLTNFEALQKKNYLQEKQTLHMQWREYLISEIQDTLRDIFRFYQTETKSYIGSDLQHLLTRIDHMFNTYLRQNVVKGNIELWCDFLKKFTFPTSSSDSEWRINNQSLIILNLNVNSEIARHKKKRGKDKDGTRNSILDKKDTVTYDSSLPAEEEDILFFEPSYQTVIQTITKMFDLLIEATNSFTILEKDIVPLVDVKKEPSFPITAALDWIVDGIARVTQYITQAFDEPNQILREFKKYSFVMEKTTKELSKQYFGGEKNDKISIESLDKDVIRKGIQSFVQAKQEISRLCINEKNAYFFQVRTGNCKETLKNKANDLIQHLLNEISKICTDNIAILMKIYNEMLEKITQTPKTEEDLITLKQFLDEHKDNLNKLDKKVNNISAFLEILEDYQFEIPEKTFQEFWDLKSYPPLIQEAVLEGTRTAKSQEAKFTENLDNAKEKFAKELMNLLDQFEVVKKFNNYKNLKDNSAEITVFKENLETATKKVEGFNRSEKLFKQPITEYEELEMLKKDFEPYSKLWDMAMEFDYDKQIWILGSFIKLNFTSIDKKVDNYFRETLKLQKVFAELEEEDAQIIAKALRSDIEKFKENLWLIELLTIEAMMKKPVFWKKVFKEVNKTAIEPNDDMSFQILKDMGMLEFREQIEEVTRNAEKEWNIEKKMNEIVEKLKEIKLEIVPDKKSGSFLLGHIDDVQQILDDQLNILIMMKASPYIKNLQKKANELEAKLIMVQDTLEGWRKCQRGWMYLEPIFSSEDIKKKMVIEKQKFDSVDKNWRTTMDQFEKEPMLWDNIESDKLKSEFDNSNRTLDVIQKSLSRYLESKRKYFPRFFFLSDDQLLEILAQTKDPELVQKHINKCFEAINLLQFSPNQEVTGMISPEKEIVPFISSINVNEGEKKGNVERWLLEIEQIMRDTLKKICRDAILDADTPRTHWVLKYPAQIIIAVNMIRWTHGAEEALMAIRKNKRSVQDFLIFLNSQLLEIVGLVRGNLTELERLCLGALVVIDVHARDVISDMVERNVSDIDNFLWLSQLRYYWEEASHTKPASLKVKIVNAEQLYGFEYLGNSSRLVITPLTDRCYRTLMGAYQLFYGGAPEGPAGTGKTESVKDLAKAVAMQCVVFNCSDGLNFRAMSKFFKGLASSGAWCCFDEFNRIELEVLSVIAQQVVTIQTAIKEKKKHFFFEDEDEDEESKEIMLIPTCSINITMNPGYAGRSELPDNLKALFRPCAMMVPDYSLIAEIFLYSVGFEQARGLARKVVASLRLSSEQLSTQDHYDFGMRALKAILTAAGDLKRKMTVQEDKIVLRALMDVNLPKFTFNDIPLFTSITSDLFPGVDVPQMEYGNLEECLKEVCREKNLIPEKSFLFKCIQLFDTINVRHGLMLVGAAFSGKSKVIDCLARALTLLHSETGNFVKTATFKLNPKSITSTQLYGLFDPDTKSWTDGVLPLIMRECANDGDNRERKWVIFDGPVDAVWIENMNTVLDDNKKLCLTTGEIIKLTNWMTMMFEVEDLAVASPATVSRCGMVYLETKNLGWEALVKAFIGKKWPKVLEKQAEFMLAALKWFLDPCVTYARKYGKFPLHLSEMNLVNSTLNLLDCLIQDFNDEKAKVPKEIEDILINYVLFCVIWAVGGVLEEVSRKGFHDFIIEMILGRNVVEKHRLDLLSQNWEAKAYNIKLNDTKNIFEICFDKGKGLWLSWMQIIPAFKIPKDLEYHELIIPTVDLVRNNYFMNLYIKNKYHLLITGPTGTGKTVNIVTELNKNYYNEDYTNLCTSFSGQTQANQIQKIIESKMNTKRRKGYFGPEDRKKYIVIFIDDLNMPAKEKSGCQPPIELLRQWMDYGGWYDLETKEFKYLCDMAFIGAMGPPSQGRNAVTARYMRHFNILYAEPFDSNSLVRIFTNILEWFFMRNTSGFAKSVTNLQDSIVQSTILLYNNIKNSKELLPTPAKSHYLYNLRDISKVFQGIIKVTPKSLRDDSDFIKLWAHECMRVFQDRMINDQDLLYFENMLKSIIQSKFKRDWSMIVNVEPLLWADFVPTIYPENDMNKRPYSNLYCELTNHDSLKRTCEEKLEEYNSFNSANRMNLVLFLNAIQHIIRIVRIMSQPFGHCLLVGVGGSGRKSLVTLCSHICTYELFNIDPKVWVEDLQKLMRQTGVDQKPTIFLISDTQLVKESMVEDVCNILNNGEVPNIFTLEDKGNILESLSSQMPTGTPNQKYGYFISKCKENLHLAICMSPVGETFRRRLRTFPTLVNCTTIDWFLPWPEEALRSTALKSFASITDVDNNAKEGVVKLCVDMQQRVRDLSERYYQELRRYFYVTPTSYLELLLTFKRILGERTTKIKDLIKRYETGLDKIRQSEEKVNIMKVELNDLKPQLQEKTEINQKMLLNLTQKAKEADAERLVCEAEERECNVQREEANQLKNDCQKDLDQVLPLLRNAVKALESLSKDDITTIKSFNQPPKALDIVMQGLCYVLGEDSNVKWKPKEPGSMEKVQNFWEHSKKFLLNDKLIKRIKDFKDDSILKIAPKNVVKLKDLIKEKDFDQDEIVNASRPAGNIAIWIRACVSTYDALLVVEPKRAKLAEAEESLKKTEAILEQKKKALQVVLDLLAELQGEYDRAKKEKDELEFKVTRCQNQLNRAEKLIKLLANELKNWAKKAADYREESKGILGDVCLTSGFISYMGVFPTSYREECLESWKKMLIQIGIPFTPKYSLQNVMADPIKTANWTNQEKLPNDSFSIDNAIILKNSTRWPLLIDPQLQGNTWIKEMEKTQSLVVLKTSMTTTELTNKLDNCIAFGVPALLENIGESIDSLFEPILLNKRVKVGGSWKLRISAIKTIDYQESFKFYMTTKLPRPHYPPEICVKVTLLNFVVTQEGLEDQMLNIVVKFEEPLKEEQRQKNIREFFDNTNKQRVTEENILRLLFESEGNILDNDQLIDVLEKSKIDSIEIEEKLAKLKIDRDHFNITRNSYKDAAKRVSNLYFVLMDLANIEPMYQFSLESYIHLFEKGIAKTQSIAPKEKDLRVKTMNIVFTSLLYDYVVRSLLEKDKLIFSFLMCINILQNELQIIHPSEVRFLTIGGTATKSSKPNPAASWLTNRQWASFEELSTTLKPFADFDTYFAQDIQKWQRIYQSSTPHVVDDNWPLRWVSTLNSFQRLLIIRILRPDILTKAIQNVIVEYLDARFIEPPPFELQSVFNDSNKMTPLIFVLSPGADPRTELMNLAEKQGFRNNLLMLSLGQGQEAAALKALSKAMAEGKWVLLQNCHLAVSFMPILEKTLENMVESTTHNEYRLWLTSMPSPDFPVSILQKGIKMTYEPPKGLKSNLMLSYLAQDPKKFDSECPNKPRYFKKLLFGLSFFHALVLERRKFGPLGWNIPYQFTTTDLAISVSQLKLYLNSYEEIPWEALNYMVAEANYGGRVTDPKDRRLINIILQDFYNDEILDDKYKFSKSGIYFAPPEGSLEDYKNYIKELPINDSPEIFGMHDNAEIAGAIYDTNELCSAVLSLLPRSLGEGGSSIETIIKEKTANILKRLPKPFDLDEVIKKLPIIYEESMNTVLQQELIRFNKLLRTVTGSLQSLIKAIDGLVSMSNELDEVFNKIFDNKVPELWQKAAYPSLKPLGSWVNDFLERLSFMQKWIDEGAPPAFWISGFYFTQSFLTGTLQNYARKYKIPIDTLGFDFTVLSKAYDVTKQPEDGCYVYGLFLDGARWNEELGFLDEPLPKVLASSMPYIWLIPKVMTKENEEENKIRYECPVYKTSRRFGTLSTTGHSTNYVLSIWLNIGKDSKPQHWVKRGVALLTQLDD